MNTEEVFELETLKSSLKIRSFAEWLLYVKTNLDREIRMKIIEERRLKMMSLFNLLIQKINNNLKNKQNE